MGFLWLLLGGAWATFTPFVAWRNCTLQPHKFRLHDVGMTASKNHEFETAAEFRPLRRYRNEANQKPLAEWLKSLGLSQTQADKLIAKCPRLLDLNIESNLKPTVEWIKSLGMSQTQVVKVVLRHPRLLSLCIESNLKPTVEWIKSLGLSQTQVVKVVLRHPQVLGLNVESNLKPTVEWIKSLGFSQTQAAKMVWKSPDMLDYSIEANLKPKVEWMKSLGLSQMQVADLIASFPRVLGLSIETNLRVKHLLLQRCFPGNEAAELLARYPRLWSYSSDRLDYRMRVLDSAGQLHKLPEAMIMTPENFKHNFGA